MNTPLIDAIALVQTVADVLRCAPEHTQPDQSTTLATVLGMALDKLGTVLDAEAAP